MRKLLPVYPLLLIVFGLVSVSRAQINKNPYVIAYFAGGAKDIDDLPAEKLSHIIFSFVGMKGNQLAIMNANDTLRVQKLLALKQRNPKLKVMVALGGWGGCETCSEVFSTAENRKAFALSTKKLLDDFKVDGFDMDWEYPTIEGYPGYRFAPDDKDNFTDLFRVLRQTLGKNKVLSFAAGGFKSYLEKAVDWKGVMPYVDFTNLMTYDLVNGNSTVTGHQTPLFGGGKTTESADNCVQYLLELGVPSKKLIVGAAFYARTWENVDSANDGLYNSGKFKSFVDYRYFEQRLNPKDGFEYHWDEVTHSPYAYNPKTKEFATFDDIRSIKEKTDYVMKKNLGGIMFWEVNIDKRKGGLVDAIVEKIAEGR